MFCELGLDPGMWDVHWAALQCYPAGVSANSWINLLVREGRFYEVLLRIMFNYFSRANILPSFLLFLW